MNADEQPKMILLVEDDEAFRLRLSKSLQKRGYHVTSVSSVAEGLSAANDSPPDYAVVDLRLKDGSGLSVIETLEKQCQVARSVVLTGYGNIPTAVAAVRLGAIDYITKPATADEILSTLLTPKGSQPAAPTKPISPDDARRDHIERIYQEVGENVSETARLLQMHRRTLQRILRRNGISKNIAYPNT
jgi:two-component system response regulator RegA